MTAGTLLVGALVQFVTAASFAYVGRTVLAGHASTAGGRVAMRAFAAWWWGMATYLTILGCLAVAGALGVTAYPLYLGALLLGIPFIALAAWGIGTYVLYLYTGSPAIAKWTAAYAALLAVLFWTQTLADATGTVRIGAFSAGVAGAADRTFLNLVYAMFAVPLLLSTLAYLSLLARVSEPAQRYRISLVGGSILAWVGGGYAGASSGNALAQLFSITLLGLGAAITVLLAFHPPRAIRAWLEKRAQLQVARGGRDRHGRLAST